MAATTLHFSSDGEIARVGRGLLDCPLPKVEWNHAASSAKDLDDHSPRDGRIYHSPIDIRVKHFRIVKVERVDRKDISIKHDEITPLAGL